MVFVEVCQPAKTHAAMHAIVQCQIGCFHTGFIRFDSLQAHDFELGMGVSPKNEFSFMRLTAPSHRTDLQDFSATPDDGCDKYGISNRLSLGITSISTIFHETTSLKTLTCFQVFSH